MEIPKNNASFQVKNEKFSSALELSEQTLLAIDKQKNELALKLAKAVRELSVEIEEKEKNVTELAKVNEQLAFEIKEKEKRTTELEAVNKELEAFSYSVSHDLRAPLRAIAGFSEVLSADYNEELDEDAKLYFSEIIRNVKKMGDLIDNLLDFSRLSKQNFFRVSVNVEEIIRDLITDQNEMESEREVSVEVKSLPVIKGDKNMLKQLFFNIISNAFKYTGKRKDAVIEIGSYLEANQQVYYVKDNGAGFDSRYYNKLFGVFQRLHSSNEFEGTGVGLAIVQKIVSKHDGRVWADGKVGEGACFYIALPTG
ncbi:His Kinase A (phospho-acceptor) domain-containing protein [Salegentibacter holothuriorum]|uniref:histidine kinase n=1 Tax=Salegentibacter holothuriorum TaxID=241145 RepID=A0A1T5C7I8_9FLAO|nr:ATP-binding protein [Salegentibacter holothuriorum]SKB55375.1 His Kinase A (phospho-acceptor) domain-containing protein [Salegentibacter holothuriorum]